MDFPKILEELNVFKQCRKYNFRLRECPTFLFIIIGFITIASMISVYNVANRYESPDIVVIIVSLMTTLIFGVGNIIVKSVERIAVANQAKSEFVNIASHQLKAPLTAIKWTVELLASKASGPLAENQASYVKTIEQENNRMIKLVNDLLNVARIESGKMVMMMQPVDLASLAERSVRDALPIAQAGNTSIKVAKEEDVPQVLADPSYVQIAIDNLISNSIKYVKDKGEIEIVVKKIGKCAEFKITDNGVGIPLHQQEKIFDKFFRSDNIMKQQTEGTGLGLFIAKAIVDSCKGKMGFSSEEGNGSTFWFTIPAVKKSEEDKPKAEIKCED